jgi:hypothetical protein
VVRGQNGISSSLPSNSASYVYSAGRGSGKLGKNMKESPLSTASSTSSLLQTAYVEPRGDGFSGSGSGYGGGGGGGGGGWGGGGQGGVYHYAIQPQGVSISKES